MKIVVCLKQTFDTEAKITLDGEGKINREGVSLIINPYDEFAIEEALLINEKAGGGEVTIVCLGREEAQESIRQGLAMGADKAILITDPALEDGDEYTAAVVLAKAIGDLEYDLILGGWRAIDDGSGQVGVRLAEILDVPSVNMVTKVEVGDGKVTATKEIEGGNEIIEVPLPAVLLAQKGLNEPRYPTMKGIMKARRKKLDVLSLSDLGLSEDDVKAKVESLKFSLPEERQAGKVLEGEPEDTVKELAKLLREEAKVI